MRLKHVLQSLLDVTLEIKSKKMNVIELKPQNIDHDPDIVSLIPSTPQLRWVGRDAHEEEERASKFSAAARGLSPNPASEMMRYAAGQQGVIKLGQGEGSAPTPDFICAATMEAMREGHTFYGNALGSHDLRRSLSDYYARIYGLNIGFQRIFATTSGSTAMHLSLTSVVGEGDEVVAITPIWKNLLGSIEMTQAKTNQVSLDYDKASDEWQLDMDKLFASVNERTKAILLVTPSNPTGWIASYEEMRTILDFARARGIWVISDEVYGRLVYEGTRATSFLDIATDDDLLLVVNSFSKAYAMTGWRMGWIVGPKMAERKISDVAMYNNLCLPDFTQYGAMAALEKGEDFISEQLDLWRGNRDLVAERFEGMGNVHMAYPEGTFYAFFKVEGEEDCIDLCKRLIDEGGVLLAPGISFGVEAKGYMRLCFAVSREQLIEALDRIEKVVKTS